MENKNITIPDENIEVQYETIEDYKDYSVKVLQSKLDEIYGCFKYPSQIDELPPDERLIIKNKIESLKHAMIILNFLQLNNF